MSFNVNTFNSDNWHRDAKSLAERDRIKTRRWGMRVTVYQGGTPGDYVLSYNLASTDLQDNANWLKVADIGATWGGGGGGGVNIYNANGTLTANRTLSGATRNLTFSNLGTFQASANAVGFIGLGSNWAISAAASGDVTIGSLTTLQLFGTVITGQAVGAMVFQVDNGFFQVLADQDIDIQSDIGNIQVNTNFGDIQITADNGNVRIDAIGFGASLDLFASIIDLSATEFRLNAVAAASPSTMFFRGDGTWAVPAGGGGGGANIYNSDGALTGDRTLDGAGFEMLWQNLSDVNLISSGGFAIGSVGAGSVDIGAFGGGNLQVADTLSSITLDGAGAIDIIVNTNLTAEAGMSITLGTAGGTGVLFLSPIQSQLFGGIGESIDLSDADGIKLISASAIDFTAPAFKLNNIAATIPASQYFRGDGTWGDPGADVVVTARGIWEYQNLLTTPVPDGKVRFDNNVSAAAITQMRVAQMTDDSIDAGFLFITLQPGDTIFIQQRSDATRWARFKLTAVGTDNGTWWQFPLEFIASSVSLPNTNTKCIVRFTEETASQNIYNSDGSLAGNRLVDGAGFELTIDNVSQFDVSSTGGLGLIGDNVSIFSLVDIGITSFQTVIVNAQNGDIGVSTNVGNIDITAFDGMNVVASTGNMNFEATAQAISLFAPLGSVTIAGDVVDLSATTSYTLQGVAAASPSTEFFRGDGTWAVPAGGGGGITTANNGLTLTGSNVQLGGPLVQNTLINGASFTLKVGTFLTSPIGSFEMYSAGSVFLSTRDPGTGLGASLGLGVSGGASFGASLGPITMQNTTAIPSAINDVFRYLRLSANANDVGVMSSFTANSNVTVTAGFGMAFTYNIENTANNQPEAIREELTWQTPTAGAEYAQYLMRMKRNTAMTDVYKIETNPDVKHIITGTTIDLHATAFQLNGLAAGVPTTQFFRGDGTWASPGGVPAGPVGAVQFHGTGTLFAGEGQFTYDTSANILAIINGSNQMRMGATNIISYISGTPQMILDSDELSTQGGSSLPFSIHPSGSLNLLSDAGDIKIGTVSGVNAIVTATGSGADASLTIRAKGAGNLIMDTLPTAVGGLPTGALWNNAGVLSIAP